MPNRSAKAGHIPYRTCVICRNKNEKKSMLRFVNSDGDIVIDWKQRCGMRGYYTCDNNDCILSLERWLKKKKRFIRKEE
jgi:hypothetical protein